MSRRAALCPRRRRRRRVGSSRRRCRSRTASKKPYVIGGIVVVVLLGIASFTSQESQREPTRRPMPSPMPADLSDEPSGGVNGRSNAGIHQNLVWHDYVLAYSGNVAWDGASNNASIAVNVSDSNTHQPLGLRMLQASVNPNAPGQIVVSTSVPRERRQSHPGPAFAQREPGLPGTGQRHLDFPAQLHGAQRLLLKTNR